MNRLRQLREEKLLTIRELSERSGVSEDTITKIENGYRKGRSITLRKLAQALGAEPQTLLSRNDQEEQLTVAHKQQAKNQERVDEIDLKPIAAEALSDDEDFLEALRKKELSFDDALDYVASRARDLHLYMQGVRDNLADDRAELIFAGRLAERISKLLFAIVAEVWGSSRTKLVEKAGEASSAETLTGRDLSDST